MDESELILLDDVNPFPVKLKEIRIKRGLQPAELARRIHKANTQIYRYEMDWNENERQQPSLDVFRKICVELQIDPKELLGLKWRCGETIKEYHIKKPDVNGDLVFHWKCPNCSIKNVAFGEEVFNKNKRLMDIFELQCDGCSFIFKKVYEK
ncbi:MAG: helix-turn-helix transcriptional regulator [Thermodesulfovibrionia bacterium]|nr:helix-turn-helix transcriptional regulator [Thermodesulfovibrionia bacterium]